jgi:hypothetical protein
LEQKSCCAGAGRCDECASKHGHDASSTGGEAADENLAPPLVHSVLNSPGAALASETLAFMEPRFAYNFGRVRVHTGTEAALSAQMVNAHAYTVGSDIVFGSGQYAPQTAAGRRLLAHELTHVIQQASGARRGPGLMIGSGASASERVADSIAAMLPDSTQAYPGAIISSDAVAAVQRQDDDSSMTQDTGDGTSQGSGGGQGEQAEDCSGWESDPQSFSKRAAELYMSRLGVSPIEVASIGCSSGPDWVCNVAVNTPSGTVIVNVLIDRTSKFVRVESKPHMFCYYFYRCLPSGELILRGPSGSTGCPSF